VAYCGEHGNEISGSVKCGVFLDWFRNCQLLTKDSALLGTGQLNVSQPTSGVAVICPV
jgi:hypothetical protein